MNILRFVLMGLSAIAACLLGWSFLHEAASPVEDPPAKIEMEVMQKSTERQKEPPVSVEGLTALRNQIEMKIETSMDYMRFFARLKTLYPNDYDAFLDKTSRDSFETGEIGSADALTSEAVRILRQSHGILAAKAEAPALQRIFDLQLALLEALATTDPGLCVDFLYGSTSTGFFQFSADNRPLVADLALAGLEAISNGQRNKIERTEPNTADFAILETALRAKGLENNEIEALLDGKVSTPPLDDQKMCHLGEVYLQSLVQMPEPSRSRIYGLAVELMARS